MIRNKFPFVIIPIFLVVVLLATTLISGCASEPAGPIEISYVTLLPKTQASMYVNFPAMDKIEEKSNGRIIFVNRGAGEAIPQNEQAPSVQRGVVDAAWTATDLYASVVPGAAMISLAEISAYEDRNTGAYDLLVEMHEKAGLRFICREASPPGQSFAMMVNKKVNTPQELAGLKMVGFGIWDRVAASLGMSPVNVAFEEYYTAMQQGLIDAVGSSPSLFARTNLAEVAGYVVKPPFYSITLAFIMNLDKWNSIPKDLQTLIIDTMFEEAPQIEDDLIAENNVAFNKIIDTGAELIEFTGADAEWYLGQLNGAAYEFWSEKAPVDGPKLYQLLQKEALNK